jgi:hypothetical protein
VLSSITGDLQKNQIKENDIKKSKEVYESSIEDSAENVENNYISEENAINIGDERIEAECFAEEELKVEVDVKEDEDNKETKEKENEVKTENESPKELPIKIIEGYNLLQSFYMNITENISINEMEKLAKECGLYCYAYDGGAGYMDLQIATEKFTKESYGSKKYEFNCDSLWLTYDSITGSYKLHHAYYYSKNPSYTIKYNTNAQKWDDSLNKMVKDNNYYNVNADAKRFYDVKEAFKAAKK